MSCNYTCYKQIKIDFNNSKNENSLELKKRLKEDLTKLEFTSLNTNIFFWENGPTEEQLSTLKKDIKNKILQLCNLEPLTDELEKLNEDLKNSFTCDVYDIDENYIGVYMQGYVWNNNGKIQNNINTLYCKRKINYPNENSVVLGKIGSTPSGQREYLSVGGTIKFKKTKRRKNSRKKTKKKQKH